MEILHHNYEGFNFRYSDQGHGQTLIFVGGAFQSIDKLGPLAAHWEKHYRLVLIELPGFGESDYLPSEYGFDFTANCIGSVVDKLRLKNIIFVGTSYGSPSVFHYVANNQHRVSAMLLGGSVAKIDKFMEYQIRFMIWTVTSEYEHLFAQAFTNVMCNVGAPNIPNIDRICHIVERSLRRMNDADKEKFCANSLRLLGAAMPNYPINIPTLVFTGEHDQFTRAERLGEFADLCSDLRIETIPDADHMYHLEQTDRTLELIDSFVRSLRVSKDDDLSINWNGAVA